MHLARSKCTTELISAGATANSLLKKIIMIFQGVDFSIYDASMFGCCKGSQSCQVKRFKLIQIAELFLRRRDYILAATNLSDYIRFLVIVHFGCQDFKTFFSLHNLPTFTLTRSSVWRSQASGIRGQAELDFLTSRHHESI